MAGECGAMSKACDRILASVREARAWARGEPVEGFRVHVPDSIDVAAIRDRAGLSQERLAAQIGVPVAKLRNWERGRGRPDGKRGVSGKGVSDSVGCGGRRSMQKTKQAQRKD